MKIKTASAAPVGETLSNAAKMYYFLFFNIDNILVMKIERQLINLVQERKGQLEELYELKYAKYFFM